MYYLEVLVSSNKYHGSEPLTYSSVENLVAGTIVQVPMRNTKASGIVVGTVTKPTFSAKAISSVQVSRPLPKANLDLLQWLADYYPAPISFITSLFLSASLLTKKTYEDGPRLPAPQKATKELPPLTKEQDRTLAGLIKSKGTPSLIHGDTGTGKTRLYIELARRCLETRKSVLVLTPEIGLTPQLAEEFRVCLDFPVLILHSNLTGTQRRNLWLQILYAAEPLVIIGPRSALFAPLENIGLIVVDEAHDNSYKQDQLPHYHALRVAGKLAQLHNAQLVFGSATPLVSEYFILKSKQLSVFRLQEVAVGSDFTRHVSVVDIKDRTAYTRNPYLSNQMIEAISASLEAGEQSLIFLNRRGTARVILCQSCGWQAMCPRCNVPLTYHGDNHSLRCHTCGHHEVSPTSCPECKGIEILYKSIGTKALVTTLQSLFPQARIQRFDTDNSKDEKLEHHYQAVRNGHVDILVGTQMLVKGLDLPLLSVVGVVAADSSLQFPDFSAEEQAYQLLSQAIGRVGRGHRESFVVIQTHNPDGIALKAVLNNNWDEFYKQQLLERERFLFPPFCYLLKVTCARKSRESAVRACTNLRLQILALKLKIEIVGPSPRFSEQSGGDYNWQLIVKSKDRSQLLEVIDKLPAGWSYDIDPTNLL